MAIAATLLTPVTLILGIGWYYSGLIEEGAFKIDREPDELNLEIVSLSSNEITFRPPSGNGRWKQSGIWGLEWDGGTATVGELISDSGRFITREFHPTEKLPMVGTEARMTREVFSGDPTSAHGLPFQEVSFPSTLGTLGGWVINGGDTWIIHVHGHSGNRFEALRSIPPVIRTGASSFVIDYRNDAGMDEDPTGYYLYGITEWEDLEAATQYALDQGARSVIPYGYSMGGGIVMSFLYKSPLAESVTGVVLDAPMLDLSRVIDQAGDQRNIPRFITNTAKFIAETRFDIEFEDLDYLDDSHLLKAPILLFHGNDDERIPVETSDALAEARPDLVTYERVAGGKHVHAWNTDPERYESTLETFLSSLISK